MKKIVLLGLICLCYFIKINSVSAQTVSCPANFNEVSRSETSLVCRFEQTLSTPPTGGQLPEDTPEGDLLLNQANVACLNVSGGVGRSTNGGSFGPDAVFLICTVELIPPDVPIAPPSSSTPQPKPQPSLEVFDFDQIESIVQNETEREVASIMVTLCTELQQKPSRNVQEEDLFQRCIDINREPNPSQQLGAIRAIAPKQYTAIAQIFNYQNTIMIGEIGNRLASIRSAFKQHGQDTAYQPNVHPLPGLLASNNKQSYGAAAGDDDSLKQRLGVYILGAQSEGDKGVTDRAAGFDYRSQSLTLGIDYLVNPSLIIGAAISSAKSDSEFDQQGGSIDIKTNSINFYVSKLVNQYWYVDVIAGLGKGKANNQRRLDFIANDKTVDQTAVSEFDSDQQFISAGAGRYFNVAGIDIDVAARVNHIRVENQRFAERIDNTNEAGFGLALEIDKYQLKSTASELSLGVSKPFSFNWGVLVPKLQARWLHEFEDGDDVLSGRFLADTSSFDFSQSGLNVTNLGGGRTIFNIPLENVDSDYANVTFGTHFLLPRQTSINASMSKSIGLDNFDYTYFSLSTRKDF